jgi:8-oxo-dGTP pyrophosphatase MutT (NUDIX family)
MNNKTHKITCHDVNGKTCELASDKLVFRPSVYGVLIENNKVLLSKQWDGYDFPGGGVDLHETLEDALKREFAEETGVEIEIMQPVFCETSFFHPSYSKKNKNQYWNCPLIYFLVRKVGGEISSANLDEEERKYAGKPEWIDVKKIDGIKFYNSVDSSKIVRNAQKKCL